MSQKKTETQSPRPLRVVGADALSFVRGGISITIKVSKSSPG